MSAILEGVNRVLVVDDEPPILHTMEVNLRARGYEVLLARTGTQALAAAARRHPDVVILDLGLPDLDGIDVIRGLRGWTDVPIIILSARAGENQKIAALDAGANDYVTKPFGMGELLARLRVALRTPAAVEEMPTIETPDFTIELAARRVRKGERDVKLTATEWDVVSLLARNPGRLVTHRQLLEQVWGVHDTTSSVLRVFLNTIRRKLDRTPRIRVTSSPNRARASASCPKVLNATITTTRPERARTIHRSGRHHRPHCGSHDRVVRGLATKLYDAPR
jgi:two-component system KDP operon response regulator KdpE